MCKYVNSVAQEHGLKLTMHYVTRDKTTLEYGKKQYGVLPETAGVYYMKFKTGDYVGKASNLQSRLRNQHHILCRHLRDLEYILAFEVPETGWSDYLEANLLTRCPGSFNRAG